jgi:transcriptional regulator with GAF, ATPase, and Fis domain
MMGVRLRSNNQVIGALFFFFEKGHIGINDLEVVQHFSYMLAPALKNILTGEGLLQQQKENDILFSTSAGLAAVSSRPELLTRLDDYLRQLFPLDHWTINDAPLDASAGAGQPLVADLGKHGILALYLRQKDGFTPRQQEIIRTMSSQLSVAFDNMLIRENLAEKETERSLLLSLGNELTSAHSKKEQEVIIGRSIHRIIAYDEMTISSSPGDAASDVFLRSDIPAVHDLDLLVRQPSAPSYIHTFHDKGMREMLVLPVRENNQHLGGIFIYMKEKDRFDARCLRMLKSLSTQIAIGMANLKVHEKMERQLEDLHHRMVRLEQENHHLQEQIRTTQAATELIGSGSAMAKIYRQISIAGTSDITVLILGEPGTGKDLVAKAIHNASPRKNKVLVKLDCMAVPAESLESELAGKFQLANGSTLFLDKIDLLPPERLHPVLAAIRDHSIHRADVRIIAATNHPIQNAVPIHLPPLRERKEDLPMLASHFINLQSQRSGKKITSIARRALENLMRYDWPGNIRELEQLIEKSVLTTTGPTIRDIPLPIDPETAASGTAVSGISRDSAFRTLDELEKDHILAALKKCNHKVGGPGGAAELLRLPPTTLHSRIKKLGIKKNLQ